MNNETIFTVGGTVQASNGLYISRRADAELLALCRQGTFAYVLTPRQLGKSSLMVRTAEQLTAQDVRSVMIDLSQIGVQVSPEAWYLGLLAIIEEQLGLQTDAVNWWQQRNHLGVTQRLTRFFEEVLLKEVDAPVVVFVDEIDTTLSLNFTDDFFAAIRYFYNARALSADVCRLSFVLIGVATPGDLIRDPQRTPFNIGQRVDLTDFTGEEALPLAAGLGSSDKEGKQILEWVMKWTCGHPYLTQRLCRVIADVARDEWSERDVDELVAKTFFGKVSEQDNNLQFVRDMLTKRAPDLSEVLYTYRDVLRQTRPVHDEEQSLIKSHLKLSGVAQRRQRELTVRNPIYAEVFNDAWIKEHLPGNWYRRARRAGVPLAFTMVLAAAVFFGFTAFASNRQLELANQFAVNQQQRANELTTEATNERARASQQAMLATEARKDAEINLRRAEESAMKAEEAKRATQRALEDAKAFINFAEMRSNESEVARHNAEQLSNANLLTSTAKLLSSQLSLLPVSALLSVEALRLSPTADVDLLHHVAEVLPIEVATLKHDAGVEVVAFSPDGKYLATGSLDGKMQLWQSGGNVVNLPEPGQVSAVAFTPDSKFLATTSRVGDVRVWDVASGSAVARFEAAKQKEREKIAVHFSPDGKYLVNVDGAQVIVRDWRANAVVRELTHDDPVTEIAMSPDGSYLVTVSAIDFSKTQVQMTILDLRTGEKTDRSQTRIVTSLAFAPDSESFVIGDIAGGAEILELERSRGSRLLRHAKAVRDVAFSPDGKYLATASDDKTATIWEVESGRPISTFQHGGEVTRVSFNADGTYLATASLDGAARVWQWDLQRLVAVMPHEFGVEAVAFSPDGQMLASDGRDKTARIWKFTPAQLTRGPGPLTSALAFSPNGKLIASATNAYQLQIWANPGGNQITRWPVATKSITSLPWQAAFTGAREEVALLRKYEATLIIVDARTGNQTKSIPLDSRPNVVALSRNGKYAAVQLSTGQGNVHVWDLMTAKEIASFVTPPIYSMSFSPDGAYLAVGTYDKIKTVQLWNLGTLQLETEFDINPVPTFIVCGPEGKYVAVSQIVDPDAIGIWETASKKEITVLKHNGSITDLQFSADGKYLATASSDQTARIWDFVTGRDISHLSYDNAVIAIAFSNDGNYLATTTAGGIVHTWFRRPDELADVICNRVGRNLTQVEWTRYVGKTPYRKTCPNLP